MKLAIFTIVFLVTLNEVMAFGEVPIDKAKKFIKKNQSCLIAVGIRRGENSLAPEVMCIQNLAFNKGTINEFSACAYSEFHLTKGRYLPTYGMSSYTSRFSRTSKQCSLRGGISELMRRPAYIQSNECAISVGHVITKGHSGWKEENLVLLHEDKNFKGYYKMIRSGKLLGSKLKKFVNSGNVINGKNAECKK